MEDGSVSPFEPRSALAGCLWERFGTGKTNSHLGSRRKKKREIARVWERKKRKVSECQSVNWRVSKSFRGNFVPYGGVRTGGGAPLHPQGREKCDNRKDTM